MSTQRISLPYNYTPRPYQLPFFEAMDRGVKRACLVHHRRAGKDVACLNYMIKEAYRRKNNYWYVFPTYAQAKKAVWEGKLETGTGYLDYIPPEILTHIDKQEMKVTLRNDSIIRFVGADKPDSLRGGGMAGIVFSEYATIAPDVWPTLEPAVLERNGWVVFNGTPMGENHFYRIYRHATQDPDWFCSMVTINTSGVFTPEQIDGIRRSGVSEEFIQQEYYCSFKGSIDGAYYSVAFNQLEDQDRITDVEYDRTMPVHTAWDLGVNNSTVIWFYQLKNNQIRVIDCYSSKNEGLDHYVQVLKDKGYVYGHHWAPHDVKNKEWGTGKTRIETALSLGLRFREVRKIPRDDGINCTRTTLSRCYFDRTKCADGIQAMKQYRREYDQSRQCFRDVPYHDWTSDYADAFRYLCISLDERWDHEDKPRQVKALSDYITQPDRNKAFFHTPYQRSYLKKEDSICLQ